MLQEGFRHHEDALPQQVVDMIREQNGLEEERYLYRNTADDSNVLVDYGFEGLDVYYIPLKMRTGAYAKPFGNYSAEDCPGCRKSFLWKCFWRFRTFLGGYDDL